MCYFEKQAMQKKKRTLAALLAYLVSVALASLIGLKVITRRFFAKTFPGTPSFLTPSSTATTEHRERHHLRLHLHHLDRLDLLAHLVSLT